MLSENKFSSSQKTTFAILIILLVIRMIFYPLGLLIWHVTPAMLSPWFTTSYTCGAYTLISISIWLNKDNLQSLNIDKPFIMIFIFTGVLIALYYSPTVFAIIIILITIRMIQELRDGQLNFGTVAPNYSRVIFLFGIGLFTLILLYVIRLFTKGVNGNGPGSLLLSMYNASLPEVVVEEVIYRGMLWMFLRALNITDTRILYIQTFLFWFSHLYYFSIPFTFWFWLPLSSLWFGILVWRSKSITTSTTAHYLYNLVAYILQH